MLYGLIGLIIGAISVYCILIPKVKQTVEKNAATEEINKNLDNEYHALLARKEEVEKHLVEAKTKSADYEQLLIEQAELNFENKLESLSKQYQEYETKIKQEYIELLADEAKKAAAVVTKTEQELLELNQQLERQKTIVDAAIEFNKRAAEMEQQQDYYRLLLSDEDLQEIKLLREIIPHLREGEPVNKIIWKIYYEKPYTNLIGRVIGSKVKTGIYKITNVTNQMCYVGQSVNIAERWRQHIKRGIGAETPTKNKLYPAMLKYGVENFTFEVIEECDRSLLDEREDYWQDYFKVKEFGYSIK